jgi:2-polyprenyl-3-methyl-5-hydroxy-6-metoxy-1,4-benzoquinol methylase
MNMINCSLDIYQDIIINAQDNEYWFPYHYVAQFENNRFKYFFIDTWSINYASTIEFLLKKIKSSSANRIVDIGCGDGRFSRELSLANPDSIVVGIDYSKRAIALASAMNPDINNLQFQSIDITKENNLSLFDTAVLMEVFEHIPIESADIFISSVRSLLREGGMLYLTVPHENKPVEYKHFQHFSVQEIINYIQPYFEIVEIVPFERISWTRKLILKALSNRFFILNNQRLLSMIYRWYKDHLFFCSSEKECMRIFVKAVAK